MSVNMRCIAVPAEAEGCVRLAIPWLRITRIADRDLGGVPRKIANAKFLVDEADAVNELKLKYGVEAGVVMN